MTTYRPKYPETIQNAGLDIENADGTTAQTLLTAGTNGAKVTSIGVISDDTSAVILNIFYKTGADSFLLGSVNVPTLSGTNGVAPAVSVLNLTDMPFLPEDLSFFLSGADLITVAPQVAVTAAKKVTLIVQYGDY